MKKLYYIKQRNNPQTGTYFVLMGAMSKTAAKRHEKPLYGSNWMNSYDTVDEYEKAIRDLRAAGESIQ